MAMNARDIVEQLRKDHEQVKELFSQFGPSGPPKTAELFCELTSELVRHEVAEEEVVYPVARRAIPNGDRLADARIKEQAAAEELLDKMEKAGPQDEQFASDLDKLHKAVLEHAEKEESLIFEPLGQALDSKERSRLGELYEQAKGAAPTHPHPHAPDTPPGNVMVGPVAALVDRARDAMRKVRS
ncbi:MAG: hemerythrin domain-containing protein [Acidimicrobiaceae bacterium]|nr:hemerythrin domain-containing protein [Acidimicrobiaceae bacterium]